MGRLSVWRVLDEMVVDFRKNKAPIPDEVMIDLKHARTVLSIFDSTNCSSKVLEELDACLVNVESYLVSEGEKRFGKHYAETWLKRIDEASQKGSDRGVEKTRFVPGFPRDQKWIRIKPSDNLSIEEIESLVKESSLSLTSQRDGYVLVYGSERRVKDFVRKMTRAHGINGRK
jgi:hypothetical protein